MIAFAGIDGTGPYSNATYKSTFANSFVNRLYRMWPYPHLRFYHRGPQTLGTTTKQYADKAFYFIADALHKRGAKAVFMAGYSRGGAAVIEVADMLKRYGPTEVECLTLFDAVDRSLQVGGYLSNTPIPETVQHVIHAMRDPKSASRESFGNCGSRYLGPASRHQREMFLATHGGLGGVPWSGPAGEPINEGGPDGLTFISPRMDKQGSEKVWKWFYPQYQAILRSCQQRLDAPTRSMPMAGTHPFGIRPSL